MIELPRNDFLFTKIVDLTDLENLDKEWLDNDHFLIKAQNGNEQLYCRVEGECADLQSCAYLDYIDNNFSSNHLNS